MKNRLHRKLTYNIVLNITINELSKNLHSHKIKIILKAVSSENTTVPKRKKLLHSLNPSTARNLITLPSRNCIPIKKKKKDSTPGPRRAQGRPELQLGPSTSLLSHRSERPLVKNFLT